MRIIENARIISFDQCSVSGPTDVAIDNGTIAEVGKGLAAKHPGAEKIDGSRGYVSPGLVCSHTHLYSALARGMIVDIAPSKDFCQQLKNLWWRLDRAIDEPILRSSALAGAADAIASGVTFLVDHHASPEFIDGSLSVIREAYDEVGIGGLLCYETTDRNGMDGAKAGVRENVRFAKEVDALRKAGKPVSVESAIGAHAPFTVCEETMGELGDAVKSTGRGAHIHVAEDKYDAVDSRYRFGEDIAQRLDRHGMLTPKTLLGHGVHLTASERELINARKCFLAHNARSNMNNAVGYNSLLAGFDNVVLGTDGMSADMLEEFKFAVFRHRETVGPWWPGDFLKCLDRGNRVAEAYTGAKYGRVEKGYRADIVFWDYDPPTPLSGENLAGHMAFGMSSRSVRSVMVGGEFALKDRMPQFDQESILAGARTQADRLWKRMGERK